MVSLGGSALILYSLGGPLVEIRGLGEFGIEEFSGNGADLLRIGTKALLVGCLVLPLRWLAWLGGVVTGGYAMLLLTFGKDVLELAAMSPEVKSAAGLATMKPAGWAALAGAGIFSLIQLLGSFFPLKNPPRPPGGRGA